MISLGHYLLNSRENNHRVAIGEAIRPSKSCAIRLIRIQEKILSKHQISFKTQLNHFFYIANNGRYFQAIYSLFNNIKESLDSESIPVE